MRFYAKTFLWQPLEKSLMSPINFSEVCASYHDQAADRWKDCLRILKLPSLRQ